MTIRSFLYIAAVLQATVFGAATTADARDSRARDPGVLGYEPGTIVIKTSERRLYYVLKDGQTISYPVAVGKAGKTWTGVARIEGKFVKPAWSPPDDIRRDNPNVPEVIPGGTPQNPMGAAAMTLDYGQYAIHGTNAPSSIGRFASYGCIRMFNQDILDLYQRVDVGTEVVVLR